MSITRTTAPARTDVPVSTGATSTPATGDRRSALPHPRQASEVPVDPAWVRRRGVVLAAGTAVWAAATLAIGLNELDPLWGRVSELSGLALQAGLFALLAVQVRTRATGTSRLARGMLRAEQVLLALATTSTVLSTVDFESPGPVVVAMDAFWPLSMLGMLVIAIKSAVAGRWRGALRGWPLYAEAYFPVVMGAVIAFGAGWTDVASATQVLTGYAVLGVLLALRPELTGAAERRA